MDLILSDYKSIVLADYGDGEVIDANIMSTEKRIGRRIDYLFTDKIINASVKTIYDVNFFDDLSGNILFIKNNNVNNSTYILGKQNWFPIEIFGEHSIETLKKSGISKFVDFHGNITYLDEKSSDKIIIHKSIDVHNALIDVRGTTTTQGISISIFGNNASVITGQSSFNKAIINCGGNSEVRFGNDCVASNVFIMQPDQHHIFGLHDHKRINKGKNIHVGNHVWLGREAMILGGAEIPDGCVVGARAITSHKFTEKNCIIAGNPAKVIRRDVIWARDVIEKDYDVLDMCEDLDGLKYI